MTDTGDPREVLERLRNVSHDDLDDAYLGMTCEDCGGALRYDRTHPRGGRPIHCPRCCKGAA